MADRKTDNEDKKYFCNVCGAEIHKDMKNCPACFNKVNRWWKTWWGILIIALLIVGVAGAIVTPQVASDESKGQSGIEGKPDYSALAVGDIAQFNGYSAQVTDVSFVGGDVQAVVEIASEKTWTCRKSNFRFGVSSPQMYLSEDMNTAYTELQFTAGMKQSLTLVGKDRVTVDEFTFSSYTDKATWHFEREPEPEPEA